VIIPKGIQNDDTITLKGLGVPYLGNGSQKGNHYVKIRVLVPKKITPQEEKLYRELYNLQSDKQENNSILDKMKSAIGK